MVADGGEHCSGPSIEETHDEVIRMLCLQPIPSKSIRREIPKVRGHYHVRTPVDSRCQHVAVAKVRQLELPNQRFMTGNDRLWKVLVHDRSGSFQPVNGQIGPVGEKAGDPFLVDRSAPKRMKQVLGGQAQKEIPKAGRIQDVGVEQRRQRVHRLLQAEFLITGSQLVQRVSTAGLRISTIGENVFGPHTPM